MNSKISTTLLTLTLTVFCSSSFAANLKSGIKTAQSLWANAEYVQESDENKITKLEECVQFTKKLAEKYPKKAEPLILQGICTASHYDLLKFVTPEKANDARMLFERAVELDDKALKASAYVQLGALYHNIISWPIGFGNDALANKIFLKALEIAPSDIDVNYFYALFLIDEGGYGRALFHLNIATNAPSRNRPLADFKRKEDVAKLISRVQKLIDGPWR